MIANGKHKKTRIYKLQDGNHIISGDDELKKYITTYYKGLFGAPDNNNFNLDVTRTYDIPQVTNVENEILSSEFTEVEVRDTIFQLEHNKAQGLMVSRLNSIRLFGVQLRMTLWKCSQCSTNKNYLFIASTVEQLFYYQSVKKPLNSTIPTHLFA